MKTKKNEIFKNKRNQKWNPTNEELTSISFGGKTQNKTGLTLQTNFTKEDSQPDFFIYLAPTLQGAQSFHTQKSKEG